jgi:hypothetical protein
MYTEESKKNIESEAKKIIVMVMDPLQDQTCLEGYSQDMTYLPTFHTIC